MLNCGVWCVCFWGVMGCGDVGMWVGGVRILRYVESVGFWRVVFGMGCGMWVDFFVEWGCLGGVSLYGGGVGCCLVVVCC